MTTRIADATGIDAGRARRSTPPMPTRCCGSPGSRRTRAANAPTRRCSATCSDARSRSARRSTISAHVVVDGRGPECSIEPATLPSGRGRRGRGRRARVRRVARPQRPRSAARRAPARTSTTISPRATSSTTSSCARATAGRSTGTATRYKRNEFGRVDPKGTVPALHAAGDGRRHLARTDLIAQSRYASARS